MVNGRNKGLSFERAIANELKCIFPDCKRHLEFQFQTALGFDLDNTGALKIQCKKFKKYAPISCLKEVKAIGIPVLITAGDREKPVACLYLDDFIRILKDIGEAYRE